MISLVPSQKVNPTFERRYQYEFTLLHGRGWGSVDGGFWGVKGGRGGKERVKGREERGEGEGGLCARCDGWSFGRVYIYLIYTPNL